MEKGFVVPEIVFGAGSLRSIGERGRALGRRALLVTGRSFLRSSGWLVTIRGSLESAGVTVTVFDGVPPEPTVGSVEAGLSVAEKSGADVVIAVGGGSVLDVGKCIAGLAGQPGSVSEYLSGHPLEGSGLPFLAAPTTSGSGSEVTPNAVLIDPERGVKGSIRSADLAPNVAIVDPEITLTLGARETAYSGMDALCQAVEAYVSRGATALTDVHALAAVAAIGQHIERAWAHGADISARTGMSLGSLLAGMAFGNARLGLVHGLAHPLGALTGLPHGLVCALVLPAVVEFNYPVAAQRFAGLAREVGCADDADGSMAASESFVRFLRSLCEAMGIEDRRHELRIAADTVDSVIEQTLASGSTKSNPREVGGDDVRLVLTGLGVVVG